MFTAGELLDAVVQVLFVGGQHADHKLCIILYLAAQGVHKRLGVAIMQLTPTKR